MRAYRIMEALSAVDEELLARCGQDCGQGRKTLSLGSVWRHRASLAAALCIALAGGAGWTGYQLMRGSGDSSFSGGQMQQLYSAGEAEAVPEEGTREGYGPGNAMGAGNGGAGAAEAVSREQEEDGAADAACEEGAEIAADGILERDEPAVMEDTEEQPHKEAALTWEEAQGLEGVGGYVPARLPEGYIFEEATYLPDASGGLTLVWSRGTDRIIWNIRKTVSGEYPEDFPGPVFASGDFGLETVRSSMTPGEDAEAADAGSRFGVLYPDGVLVSFDGCAAAEEIWDMFRSMGVNAP